MCGHAGPCWGGGGVQVWGGHTIQLQASGCKYKQCRPYTVKSCDVLRDTTPYPYTVICKMGSFFLLKFVNPTPETNKSPGSQ